jgi:hypothetical protein
MSIRARDSQENVPTAFRKALRLFHEFMVFEGIGILNAVYVFPISECCEFFDDAESRCFSISAKQ